MIDNFTSILMSIGITDIIDILIVAFVCYRCLEFIRETRAQQLVRGLFIVFVAFVVSQWLNLSLLNWLLKSLITVGLIAIIVLFTPEIRRGLETVGRKGIISDQFRDVSKEEALATVHTIVDVCDDFSSSKTGALIAIERTAQLNDIAETGVAINGELSIRFLENLFYEGSPLHDGAVIIRGTKVHAASCVLPLTIRTNIGGNLGTRHRAGVGLSEVSDALVIIVSEESGAISVAENGELIRFVDLKTLEKKLLDVYIRQDDKPEIISRLLGGKKNEK